MISRLRTKAPDIKTITVVDRSFPFRDQELLSVQCANFRTDVYEVLKLFDSSGDKRDEKMSDCSSTPKLVQAHDSSVSLANF